MIRLSSLASGRRALGGAAILSMTMVAVSAANYGLNVILVRLLEPAQFGDVALAITIVLTAGVVAATLQMVASRSVAADPSSASAVRRVLLRAAAVAGSAAFVLLGAGAWVLSDLLRTSSPWIFVIIAAGLPVYFVQAVHRGILQGRLRFVRVAASYAAEAVVRLVIAVVLVVAGLGAIGAAVGILLSFLASAAVAWTRRPAASGTIGGAALGMTVVSASMMLLAQTLVNNVDVVTAKAVFAPSVAGAYAAAAVMCRALYFLAWTIIQVSVPLLASATTTRQRRRIVLPATGLIALLGAGGGIVAATVGEPIVRIVFGSAYDAAAPLLLPYVLCATVLSLSTLVAAVDLAAGRVGSAAVLLVGALLQIPILLLSAVDPLSLIVSQTLTVTLTLAGQGALAIVRGMRAVQPHPASSSLHTPPPVTTNPMETSIR
jgi:O-antigen/teichoic acid export membrane protein